MLQNLENLARFSIARFQLNFSKALLLFNYCTLHHLVFVFFNPCLRMLYFLQWIEENMFFDLISGI